MKIHHYTLVFLTSILCFGLSAQSDSRIAQNSLKWVEIEKIDLPELDNAALLASEMSRRAPGLAPKYAENIAVDISPLSSGTWSYTNDHAIWRLIIESKNAKSLNLGFTRYEMPEGGTLVMYNEEQSEIVGPFSAQDNETHSELWTPILQDDNLVVEVVLPIDKKDDLRLHLGFVNHDFMGFGQVVSGSCNLDVICGTADGFDIVEGYRDIIRSVAVIGTGGGTFCTGFLINNVNGDGKPFFMTAAHCGINAGNAASLVTYWKFENSTCRQPNSAASGGNGDGQLNIFNTGSTYRAGYAPTDFTLVELDDPIPDAAQGFMAGYSLSQTMSLDTTIGIHHPSTDEKRISFEFGDTYRGNWGSGNSADPNGDHIIVPDWDIGTTEGGSSGSPLFDKEKRVIGQLHGGGAACGNDLYDSYGWFYASWEGGGTPGTRLRDWLDPDNTGVTSVNGLDLDLFVSANPSNTSICAPQDITIDIQISPNFEDAVSLSLSPAPPAGVVASFSQNPVNPGENVTLSFANTQNFGAGSFSFNIEGTDGTNTTNTTVGINSVIASPEATTLTEPADQIIDVPTNLNFAWENQADTELYDFQIATDANFVNVVTTINDIAGTSTSVTNNLDILTDYFWRVRGINICGAGDWTNAFTFKTASIFCSTSPYLGDPQVIGTSAGDLASAIQEISQTGFINEVKISNLQIDHTYVGDLNARLIAPSGTSVLLFDRIGADGGGYGCGSNNLVLSFSDFATATAQELESTCNDNPAASGEFQPLEPLSVFNGEDPNGVWTVEVADFAASDGGEIVAFDIDICASLPNTTDIIPVADEIEICQNSSQTFSILIGTAYNNPVTLSASGIPASVVLTYSENPATPGSSVDVTIASGNTPVGDYMVEWLGNDGINSGNGGINLEIIDEPVSFLLNSPSDGAYDEPQLTEFNWESSPGATSYLLEIFEQGTAVVVASETVTESMATVALAIGGKYDWTVTSFNDCGEAAAINTWSFDVIGDLGFSSNVNNVNSCIETDIDFSLTVGEGYFAPATIDYSIAGNPSVTVNFDQDQTMVSPGDVVTGTINFDATNSSGNYPVVFTISDSDHNSNTQLTVQIEAEPGVFELLTPINTSEVPMTQPSLDWGNSPSADEYNLVVASDPDFNNVVVNTTLNSTAYNFNSDLEVGVTYYWMVSSSNPCGEYQSEIFSFKVVSLSISELDGLEFQVVPNPFKDFVDVQVLGEMNSDRNFEWNLVTANGMTIKSGNIQGNSTMVSTDELPAGVYFIQVTNAQGQVVQKIVKF